VEDVVIRGLAGGGINTDEIVEALRVIYTRVPAIETAATDVDLTPG
jgi:hypothetical protein